MESDNLAAPAPGGAATENTISDDESAATLFDTLKLIATLGRQDIYAEFVPAHSKKPHSYAPRYEAFTDAVLRCHLNGGPFVGVYIYPKGADRSRLLVFDLDDHAGTLGWPAVSAVGLKLRGAAEHRGLRLLFVRSGNGAGIHAFAHWEQPQPGRDLRALGKVIVEDLGFAVGDRGIALGEIEVFPKQDKVTVDRLGNLVALPFGRLSVPLDDDIKPIERPLAWPSSAPVPPSKVKPSTKPVPRTWTPLKVTRLRSALSAVSADDYTTWVRYGQAVKRDLAEAGFLVWDEWSRTSGKYPGESEAWHKWESFDLHGDVEPAVTTASIFYDAETRGWLDPEAPQPLGYTDTNGFAVYDAARRQIVIYSPEQLAKPSQMAALAAPYWRRRFPWSKGFEFDFAAAAQWIMERCKAAGPFTWGSVRGRGVWRDGDQIIKNIEQAPTGHLQYRYVCFEPYKLPVEASFAAARLLRLLQMFQWADERHAELVLGWMATAPICGSLSWRVHIWPYGPAECGKTTLAQVMALGCAPMLLSALGGSTAAGIRQKVGRVARGVILDDMDREDDSGQRQIREVLRLMRVASSADQTLLRGTADHTGQEFQVACSFAITAINPCAMEAADESRIVMMKMLPHDNRLETRRTIREELAWLRSQQGRLCRIMIDRADLVHASIDRFELAFAHLAHQRQRQNIGTLMAAAWVALHGTVPSETEAQEQAVWLEDTAEAHGEAFDRDPGIECLEYLFAYMTRTRQGEYPLRHWIGAEHHELVGDERVVEQHRAEARRQMDIFGLKVDNGLLVRNGHPAIKGLFKNTKWANGGWLRALRQIDGATPTGPIKWPGGEQRTYRGTLIPAELIPEPMEIAELVDARESSF
jgi:hypothetical protein